VCLPLPGETPFGALASAVLPGVYGAHPDFNRIDWNQVLWFKSGQPWQPDAAKSLQDNGLGHKDVIRFRSPGLTGIGGSFS
jgi:phenol hydroxylase P4 protein